MTNNKNDLSIFTISDLHICSVKDIKKMDIIIEYLINNKFDITLVVGDIIDSTATLNSMDVKVSLIEFFVKVSKLSKIYFVNGNHDLGYFDKKKVWKKQDKRFDLEIVKQLVKYKNITYLDNKTVDINNEYTISGIVMPYSYCKKDYDGDGLTLKQEMNKLKFLKKLSSKKTNILICHYPKVIFKLEECGYLDNVDLAVVGHYHSGVTQNIIIENILNLFNKNKGLITPNKSFKKEDTKYMRGILELKNGSILVMNPSIKTVAKTSGIFGNLNFLFYMGASTIYFKRK